MSGRGPGWTDRARRVWQRVPRGAALLSALIFTSYLLGLVRDRLFARTFGAGPELDAYNAAFVLPELLLDVLVEAGLAAPFIPIFLALRSTGDGTEGDRFARTILTGENDLQDYQNQHASQENKHARAQIVIVAV